MDAPADSAAAGSRQLAPAQDTWLRQQFPDDVEIYDHIDGESLDLRCGSGSTTGRANRIILQFDLSTLAGCQVTSASVNLYFFQDDFAGVNPTFSAHRLMRAWSDTTATWNTPWTSPGGDFDSTIESSVVVTAGMYGGISWDVTALARSWLAGSVPNDGVEILEANDNAGNDGRKEFYSTRAAQDHPYLQVTCD